MNRCLRQSLKVWPVLLELDHAPMHAAQGTGDTWNLSQEAVGMYALVPQDLRYGGYLLFVEVVFGRTLSKHLPGRLFPSWRR
jgi:hypothetical protein